MTVQPEPRGADHTAFLPVLLLGLSLLVFLGWNVAQGVREYRAGLAAADRQRLLGVQAAEAEARLQTMMLDLLTLARTNTNAQRIVQQFAIQYTPSAEPGRSLGATPAP